MPLQPGEFLIDDSNFQQHAKNALIDGHHMFRGWRPRDFGAKPVGSLAFAPAFNLPLIPRSEWSDRIKEMEGTQTRISDMVLQAGIPSKNQQQTNYCWCNAVVTAMETLHCVAGDPYENLSPASAAAQITGFQNVGGNGIDAVEFIAQRGLNNVHEWPANAISRQYATAANAQSAAKRKLLQWYDLNVGSRQIFDEIMTCLFYRMPVPVGLGWWHHEVCLCDPVETSPGQFGTRFRNSWGDGYGSNGFAVLNESKSIPNDATAPYLGMTTP